MLLATVKGDVHDIGKNIVGVVLGCNNYEVIDLGVMVPAEKILRIAKNENADIIGLSGLITPSLDEMVYVAKEMKRQEFETPLLIGGATTSSKHTAIKIAPEYDDTTVRVKDASRVSHIVSDLLNLEKKIEFDRKIKNEQGNQRKVFENKSNNNLVSYEEAYKNRLKLDWKKENIAIPSFIGLKQRTDYPLDEIRKYIDWTPFFRSWDLHGSYPNILKDQFKIGFQYYDLQVDDKKLVQLNVEGNIDTQKIMLIK